MDKRLKIYLKIKKYLLIIYRSIIILFLFYPSLSIAAFSVFLLEGYNEAKRFYNRNE